jgi:hypothetical protein
MPSDSRPDLGLVVTSDGMPVSFIYDITPLIFFFLIIQQPGAGLCPSFFEAPQFLTM